MASVDVVIPCYRYGRYLSTCVDSVLHQTGVDVRALIIDDASPDDSAEVGARLAEADPRVHFLHHQSNRGHIRTYNEGLEWATGDYTMLLSADDHLLPGALARATALMEVNPDVTFAFGRALELFGDGSTRQMGTGLQAYDRAPERVVPGGEFIEDCGGVNRVPTPTAVVRTCCQRRVGHYRTELPHTGDMEMWLRLAAHGSVGFIGECQAVYRRHAANMSLGYFEGYLPDLLQRKMAIDSFLQRCGDRLSNPARVRYRMSRSLGLEAIWCAHGAFNAGSESFEEIMAFAVAVCPMVRCSAPWLKLAVKSRLGRSAVRQLRAAFPRRAAQ